MSDPAGLSYEVIGTWVAMAGVALSYVKDKIDASKQLGRLEEKVESLETQMNKVDALRQEIHQTNVHLARVEAKLDSLTQMLNDGFSKRN